MIAENADLVENATLTALDQATLSARAEEKRRGHLGMSQIGHEDARTLWLRFRWSLPDDFSAKLLRVFRMGHVVESETAALLRRIPGVEMHTDADGSQFSFHELGGHFSGSMDGCIRGVPEAPSTWHVWECKSAKKAGFRELLKAGSIAKWNETYWVQAQCYMGASGMSRALFTVYNKDSSEIFAERLRIDKTIWPAMIARAERIITADEPPESVWPNREFYKVRFMSERQQAIYWGDQLPEPNCRNCRFASPLLNQEGAVWSCRKHRSSLSLERQQKGCPNHNWLPAFIPGKVLEAHADFVTYKLPDGFSFSNVEDDAAASDSHHVYSSWDLAHLSQWDFKKETFENAMAAMTAPAKGPIRSEEIPF
ncbi:hypothetical protein MAIT1_04014 [Magnetofaba australis IT-1]|uniref:YqaJ viral recombinase domain-containing protein n=2 Tax=Magnetofaba TaxID=1472292 RepID=A0A1Y2K586_9PROT|nr:hypothetical protein MAIT1_04014 [Magnetofaba australis IT-1]